ncbi:MAG: hypothetical protein WCF74_00100 [Candidatus Sulfotelmatobacter sp.]
MDQLLPITLHFPASIAIVSNIAGVDPDSGEIVRLFHPRRDRWTEHFVWDGPRLEARTPVGRTTVTLLRFNEPEILNLRKALLEEGVFEG